MKKIVINGKFLTQEITGVQRYAREICAELDKLIQPNEIIIAVPPEAKSIPVYRNIRVVKTGIFHNRLWEQISFPYYVWTQNGISLNLCNASPLVAPGIVCIHDVKIKATPQFFNKKFLLWYNLLFFNAAKRAQKIITVSEFSKSEIIKYYKVEKERIYIVPNGWQHFVRIKYDENTLNKYNLEKGQYFFALGSLEPNKNFKWIAKAAKNNPDLIFAVAGSINYQVFAEGMGFECPKNMKLLGYITDEEAKTLMRDCKAFLFPSIYEGFGIPPLEAMSVGAKRIIVSDISVMHEIFGDSVEYIDTNEYKFDISIIKMQSIRIDVLKKYSWWESALLIKNIKKGGSL